MGHVTAFRPGLNAALGALVMSIFLAVLFPAFATAALVTDAYETDDTSATATMIVPGGTSQSRTLLSTSGSMVADYDWVSFVATAGVTYDIRTSPGGAVNPDTVLSLFDSDGSTLLAYNDDFFGPFSRIEWTCDVSRVVYVQVTDADTYLGSPVPQTGEYTLAVAPGAPGITGTVTDVSSGGPISGITVSALAEDAVGDWYVAAWTRTLPDGTYALFGLFDGEFAIEYRDVTAFDGQYKTEYYDDRLDIDSADLVTTVDGSTEAGIDAGLTEIYSITGRATADAGGSPLRDVAVKVWQWNVSASSWVVLKSTTTGVDGSYAVGGLGSGVYRVQFVDVTRHVYRTQFFGDGADVEDATDVTTLAGATVANVDASMAHTVQRVYGRDRYTTAVAIARATFPEWSGVADVIIASGDDRAAADPLAASGMCWAYDAPLLLVSARRTPDEVKALVKEIADANGFVRLHIVGGPVSVPTARIDELKSYVGGGRATSERVLSTGGRYDLAAAIARRMATVRPGEMPKVALVANGADSKTFFDALALSAISRSKGMPIVLVQRDAIPPATGKVLTDLGLARRIIGGGPNTVTARLATALHAERWWGRTRYDTVVAIAGHAVDEGILSPYAVAIVAKVPDGLTGGAFVGSAGGPLLLTAAADAGGGSAPLSPAARGFLLAWRIDNDSCYALGGTNSVSGVALAQASLALE